MLILHDPATLEHKTVELLGAKVIPALESPERISAILEAVQASNAHEIKTVHFSSEPSSTTSRNTNEELLEILSSTHDAGYLHHLSHAHSSWVNQGLIDQHESILPECFPYPNSASGSRAGARASNDDASTSASTSNADPPRDIFARAGFYAFDMSTGICASTYTSALASANLACYGVRLLFDDSREQPLPRPPPPPPPPPPRPPSSPARTPPTAVLALCRPPGHHCDTRRAGGYCYLNNAVVAVATFRLVHAQKKLDQPKAASSPPSLNTVPSPTPRTTSTASDTAHTRNPSPPPPVPPRITILDLDFHHGNGTQEAFYADASVLYISIHGLDEYPYYTGSASETGLAPAINTNLNLPLPAHSSITRYLETLDLALDRLVAFHPEFVVISLGFDTFHLDPLGSFEIETDDYATISRRVVESLRRLEAGSASRWRVPCLILLEGGYVIDKLGPNLLCFLRGWEGV